MKKFQTRKELTIFLDESGDLSLDKINPDYPIFAIAAAIFEPITYVSAVDNFNKFKMKYFSHEGLILHSREIADRTGEFVFLNNDEDRKEFLSDISELIQSIGLGVCASVIKKDKLKSKYAHPFNPYDLAFGFIFEKVFNYACNQGFDYIHFITEARGGKEDKELHGTFDYLRRQDDKNIIRGFPRYINQQMLDKVHLRLEFRKKEANVVGLQIADLLVTPIAQSVFKGSDHPSLKYFKDKFIYGINNSLKVFP